MFNNPSFDLYFAIFMVILFVVVTVACVYFFVRLYKKEQANQDNRNNHENDGVE